METYIKEVKFKGEPTKALFLNIAESVNLFDDRATTTRLVYVEHHLYKETITVGINPDYRVPTIKTRKLISSNIIEESWDCILNNQ